MFTFLLSSTDFFQNLPFQKVFQEHYQSVKRFWIHIRINVLSVLIWIQTFCKVYQQTTKVAASKERVKNILLEGFRVTVLPAKSDSGVMFCLQSYHRLRIDRPLVY